MNELDQIWSQMLDTAAANARVAGRHDVADYLALKATNDAVRQTGTRWLFDAMIEIAGEANRNGSAISIEREDPHNFAHRGSNIVGSLLRIRHGVRCLTIEAGWTRTPTDGFMRGGALAFARLTHFGMPKKNAELMLKLANGMPEWDAVFEDGSSLVVNSAALRQHFDLFLG